MFMCILKLIAPNFILSFLLGLGKSDTGSEPLLVLTHLIAYSGGLPPLASNLASPPANAAQQGPTPAESTPSAPTAGIAVGEPAPGVNSPTPDPAATGPEPTLPDPYGTGEPAEPSTTATGSASGVPVLPKPSDPASGSSGSAANMTAAIPGLGLAINAANVSGTTEQLDAFHPSWYYDWRSAPTDNAPHAEFVPMLWSSLDNDVEDFKVNQGTWEGVTSVLAFNEPDGKFPTGGTEVTPERAAELHVELLNDLPYKIGAPALRDDDETWFPAWVDACDALGGCKWDILPLHWYGPNATVFAAWADKKIEERGGGKEIWLSEYGCVIEWVNNKAVECETEDIETFMVETLKYIKTKGIARYSYFGAFKKGQGVKAFGNHLMDASGEMTDLAKLYISG